MTFTTFEIMEMSWKALENNDKAYNKLSDLIDWMEESGVEAVTFHKPESGYGMSVTDEGNTLIHETSITMADLKRNK